MKNYKQTENKFFVALPRTKLTSKKAEEASLRKAGYDPEYSGFKGGFFINKPL